MVTITVSEAKKKLLELIRRVEEGESAIIEKKGNPVAALLTYDDYVALKRVRDYLVMHRLSSSLKESGLAADEIYRESRRELERGD